MACIESKFFCNTASLTVLSFTPARAPAELPQLPHFHTATTTGILTSHSLRSRKLIWMLFSALMCLPAPCNTACFTAPNISRCPSSLNARRPRPAPHSTLSARQPPSHQHLLIYFMVSYLPGRDHTAFLSPGAYNSSFLSPNHKDCPRDEYPEDYTHKLDWEIQIGRSKHRIGVTF